MSLQSQCRFDILRGSPASSTLPPRYGDLQDLSSARTTRTSACSFARHGTYMRKTPRGTRVARWYCPQSRTTFSLLPDCLAARLPGTLDCARSGRRACRARIKRGDRSERAARRHCRPARRHSLGPAPVAPGPSRPDRCRRLAARAASARRFRYGHGARPPRNRQSAHGPAPSGCATTFGAAHASWVSPSGHRRCGPQSSVPT